MADHEQAKTELELAEQTLNGEAPKLHMKNTHYQAALEKQQKLQTMQQKAPGQQQELNELKTTLTNIQHEIKTCQDELAITRATLGTLQRRIHPINGEPERERNNQSSFGPVI